MDEVVEFLHLPPPSPPCPPSPVTLTCPPPSSGGEEGRGEEERGEEEEGEE